MRWLYLAALLLTSSLSPGQEENSPERKNEKKPEPPPVTVVSYDFPREVQIGEEFTFTAKVKNNVGRLALVALRLQLDPSCQVLPPNAEQAVFVETGAPRTIAWRVKRVGEGKLNGNVESYRLTAKQGREQSIPPDDKAALAKVWEGKFVDATSEFGARLEIKVHPDGFAEGKIHWKLLKHSLEERKSHIGKEGIEFVWGSYEPMSRVLAIDGYRREDAAVFLGLDRYRLTLSAEGIRLRGSTWNHGLGDGKFTLTPVEE